MCVRARAFARAQPFKTEGERRKHQLDVKRRELVEARLKPGGPPSPAGGELREPRPPSGPRPDPSLGFSHPITPRRLEGLEVEGQPPPTILEGHGGEGGAPPGGHPSGAQTAR